MSDSLQELLQFLVPTTRIDIKVIALEHLLNLSGSDEGIECLLGEKKLLGMIFELTKYKDVNKLALLILVNVTAHARGAIDFLQLQARENVETLLSYIKDVENKDADAACMILSNITRVEENLKICADTLLPHLSELLKIFVNLNYNKRGGNLHYLAPIFSNISRCPTIRKWWFENDESLNKLFPFLDYQGSSIRRGGVVGTIRNLSFDTKYHSYLLDKDLDLLPYLLSPIMGGEEYVDEEMEKLPISLQLLSKEKKREPDVDIRKMIIETLNKFCALKFGREILRDNGVYYILREYHKWEKDPPTLLACENVVDILIQCEEEVGAEDLSSVEVPQDMVGKFDEMDKSYLSS